eukprot:XP_006590136.1 uncharacterized protein LOC100802002 [Glycine max]
MSRSAPSSSRLFILNEELEMLFATVPKLTNEEHEEWCEMAKMILKVAVPPNTIYGEVSMSFAVRWKNVLDGVWHFVDKDGNYHNVVYNKDLDKPAIVAGWTTLREYVMDAWGTLVDCPSEQQFDEWLKKFEMSSKDVISVSKDTDYVIEIKADAASRSNDDVVSQTDRITSTRKTWTTPNYGVLKIAIADEGEQRDKPTWTVDATPKEKGFRNLFWKQKFEEYPQAMRAVCMFNQRFEHIGICQSQRQFQSPLHLRYGCSVQVTLALMLTIFLIVPFVLYSTRVKRLLRSICLRDRFVHTQLIADANSFHPSQT